VSSEQADREISGWTLRLKAACVFAFVLSIAVASAEAKVFYAKSEALQLAFPGADRVENKIFFLREDQVEQVQELARAPLDSKLVTIYVGRKAGEVIGYAYIDTHTVRTLPETVLVVLSPDGAVRTLHMLAFYEPQEYLAPERWLGQFEKKTLGPDLRVRRAIHGIAGSTLSAQAVTAAVRRALALYAVLLKGKR